MKKTAEYRQHAAQCRALAKAVEGDERRQLLQMATDWEALAAERAALLHRYPELACEDEPPVSCAAG